MKELLEKYETRITTPESNNRLIDFLAGDEEFSAWGFSGQNLYFNIRSGGKLTLTWNGRNFEGKDPRGGYSILRVDQTKLERFREYLKSPTKLNNPIKKEIDKVCDFAVISQFEQSDGDHYEPEQNLKEQVDKLFDAEYNRVYLLNFSPSKGYFQASHNACDKLNCHFVNAEGSNSSESPLDLSVCSKLGNYMIPISTWARIKAKVKKSKKNLTSACSDEISAKNLKIYGFSKSRIKNMVPNDNNLKNFRLEDAKTKS